MVKKLFCALLACLLLLPAIALAETRVFDEANLFTASETQQLEAYIDQLRETYQMDVAVLTSTNASLNRSMAYAESFFESHGLGMGEDEAGLVFFIDMKNRVPTILTSGVMIDYITDHRLDVLLDAGYDNLARGRYASASMQVLQQLNAYLRQGREEGSFRYDAVTGQRLSGLYNALTPGEMLVAAIVGFAVALVFVLTVKGGYELKGGTYNYNVANNFARAMIRDDEQFVNQRVVRYPRQQQPPMGGGRPSSGSSRPGNGMGSSVHRSSTGSGRSFGGGSGRKF